MSYTVSEISKALGIPFEGNGSIKITSISTPDTASSDQLVVAISKKYLHELKDTKASVALMFRGAEWQSFGLRAVLLPEEPRLKMAEIFNMYENNRNENFTIHETALIDASSQIGENVSIGNNCSIGHNTIIEKNVSIGNNCSIGSNNIIRNSYIKNGVKILDNCVIGKHGFGFFPKDNENLRYPHIGIVLIEDNCEIGCGSTIDRGSMSNTIIGKNTYLDNQIHIAHNVKIGNNTILAGQVGIAGSSTIGNNVRIGGQAGISGHLKIGNNVEIAGGSGVIKSITDNSKVMGYPAKNIREFLKENK